jgi:hypothetical protein
MSETLYAALEVQAERARKLEQENAELKANVVELCAAATNFLQFLRAEQTHPSSSRALRRAITKHQA